MISRIFEATRRLRKKISRSRLAARLFGHEIPQGTSDKPGLIMIQVDGLSRTQMEAAMRKGRLPFLKRLIRERHFSLESFYSGMPSTTPAVQGEIFYGPHAAVPLVLFLDEAGTARAYNAQGEWKLSEDPKNIFGAGHPFLEEVAQDTDQLCRHPDAGDFVISGWDPQQPALSFPLENGAHGGPGPEETHGFLLLPDRIRRWHLAHLPRTNQRVRGEELWDIALHYLGGEGPREERVPQAPQQSGAADTSLRIMSYNLHSCRGLDGKVRPERIARVINAYDPDLVAVQEVDAHRVSSGSQDQAHLIARHLRMGHVFQTMLEKEGEGYGIAIFSKYPFETIRAGFPSMLPVFRLDHIFLSDHFTVRKVEVPKTAVTSVASDHLPLCEELSWASANDG